MKVVTYSTSEYLSCAKCFGNVIVCTSPDLTVSQKPYLEGRIVSVDSQVNCAGVQYYIYGIAYDEIELLNPEIDLTSCQVTGVICRGCLTEYIDSSSGGSSLSVCAASEVEEGTLVVCNGSHAGSLSGGTLGQVPTVTNAETGTVQFQSIVSVNPCEGDEVSEGSLLICSGGNPATLQPTALGQVPVVTNVENNTVEFQSIAAADPCNGVPIDEGALLVCGPLGAGPLIPTLNGQVPVVTDAISYKVQFQTPVTGWASNGWFGMGYDGDATIAVSTNLTGDKGYANCTVNAGVTVKNNNSSGTTPAGSFRIFCSDTLDIEGTISADGVNGADSFVSGPGPGTVGPGADSIGRTLGGTGAGSAGANGSPLSSAGVAGYKCGMGGAGGAGGTGGDGALGGNAGGTGGLSGALRRYDNHPLSASFIVLPIEFSATSVPTNIGGGSGGGAGGAGGGNGPTNVGGQGGGGGGGGGFVFIAAKHIILRNTGVISARGGIGQDGKVGSTPAAGIVGGGGGGAGGGGGVIYLIYETFTDEGGTITVAGGAGGGGGPGLNLGEIGDAGASGSTGRIVRFNTRLNAYE